MAPCEIECYWGITNPVSRSLAPNARGGIGHNYRVSGLVQWCLVHGYPPGTSSVREGVKEVAVGGQRLNDHVGESGVLTVPGGATVEGDEYADVRGQIQDVRIGGIHQ